ncbi:unnamed protein product [Moneuplotes crassus]|uniref:Uncharacterized protein n=1 Tax=Euplotes crassus TaxID=5936 RepID=A0AAD1XRC0_EUPCR|nr:unnamed protein product [Moneuplotes crassus]
MNKEEMFLYNDDVNGNKIVLLYNDDEEEEQEDQNEHIQSQEFYRIKGKNSSLPREPVSTIVKRPATGSMRRNLKNARGATKRNNYNMGMVNMSKRLKTSSKKQREGLKGRMIMTQSSPFIKRGIQKPTSPERDEMGGFTRKAQSRVSRYNFNKKEMETYSNFVELIAMFDSQSMADILEDVLKDAEELKGK